MSGRVLLLGVALVMPAGCADEATSMRLPCGAIWTDDDAFGAPDAEIRYEHDADGHLIYERGVDSFGNNESTWRARYEGDQLVHEENDRPGAAYVLDIELEGGRPARATYQHLSEPRWDYQQTWNWSGDDLTGWTTTYEWGRREMTLAWTDRGFAATGCDTDDPTMCFVTETVGAPRYLGDTEGWTEQIVSQFEDALLTSQNRKVRTFDAHGLVLVEEEQGLMWPDVELSPRSRDEIVRAEDGTPLTRHVQWWWNSSGTDYNEGYRLTYDFDCAP